jgi:tetratricopeptide (TPR) repeat protein
MQCLKLPHVIAVACVFSQTAFAQYKIGDRLVVISQAEIRSGGIVRQILGRGQDVRVDGVNQDQLLVKNLAAGWINQELVSSPAVAVSVFSENIARNPLDAGAYYARGITRADLNQYDLAIADFTQAIRLAPSHACGFNGRGNCWANLGVTAKAIADYTDAILLDPNAAITFANRARMWNVTGDFAKAIADATEAIRIAPTYANAYSRRAQAFAATNRFDDAIADCDRIAAISVPGISGYCDVAWFLAMSPDARILDGKKAVDFAAKAYELTKGLDAGVLDTLAIAWAESADFDQAVTWEKKAIAISSPRDLPDFKTHLMLFETARTLRDAQLQADPALLLGSSKKTEIRRLLSVGPQREILSARINH